MLFKGKQGVVCKNRVAVVDGKKEDARIAWGAEKEEGRQRDENTLPSQTLSQSDTQCIASTSGRGNWGPVDEESGRRTKYLESVVEERRKRVVSRERRV